MAGKITYLAPVDYASGKILGKSQKWLAVHRSWGNRQRGCAVTTERNYVTNPLTTKETNHRNAFKAAAALRKLILDSATLRTNWSKRFSDDRKAGTTECTTLNGYLMKEAMAGNIDDDGSYLGA